MEALILILILWAFGSWLADKAKEFEGAEERLTLRAENAKLRLALEASEDDRPGPGERAERISAAFESEHGAPGPERRRD